MSDNFIMGHAEIRFPHGHAEILFLVISAIHDFTNFLQRYRNLSMTVAFINSYSNMYSFFPCSLTVVNRSRQ